MLGLIGAGLKSLSRLTHVSFDRLVRGSVSLQIGRTLLAVAQATVVLLTPWRFLTPSLVGDENGGPSCGGVGALAITCVGEPESTFGLVGTTVVLALVASGFFPQITAILHAYVSFSIATSFGLPDGGEQIAQIFSILLIPLSFVLPWLNGWRPKASARGGWMRHESIQGIVVATWVFARLQFAFVYLESGISKLATEDWLNGSAMYYVFRDPSFGATGILGDLALWVTDSPLGTAAISWGTIIGESMIGVLLLVGRKLARRVAFILIALLHVGIIAFIGLWSFGLIMIAVAICVCIPFATRSPKSRLAEMA